MCSWCIKIYKPGAGGNNYHRTPSIIGFMYFNMIVIIFIVNLTLTLASQSGIYVDNGVDQTIMHRILDDTDRVNVEHEILEFLGLPESLPSRKHGGHLSLRTSAPQFLLDVYHRLNENEEHDETLKRSKRHVQGDDSFITDVDKQGIDQSDIIMTFLSKNHHVAEVRHEHGRRLWFDVSEVSDDNQLMIAELRLYQKPPEDRVAESEANFTISVYSIVQIDGERELELLSSVNTTSHYRGWLELNVTEGLEKWLLDPRDNKGIYVGAHEADRPEHEVKLESIRLVHEADEEEHQPFLIGFFQGPDLIKKATQNHSRRKRDTRRTKWSKKSEVYNPLVNPRHDDEIRSCHIQTLYIDFKDINWQDWVIKPDGFSAFYCGGECNFPMNAHMNATNHAIVQTLVHLLEPKKVPKPCCVPTKLVPLSLLYFIDDKNVNLQTYKNMIVKSCGCH